MTASVQAARGTTGFLGWLNTRGHKAAMVIFGLIVVGHWAEHVAQAWQVWVLQWPRPKSGGLLGLAYPWLVSSEWLHYGYAVVMLAGLLLLRPAIGGRARKWWSAALWIQVWHHFEHLLLLVQALTGSYLLGRAVPTSVVQLIFPRIELHLFYNALVTIPMVVAMVLHLRPRPEERDFLRCSCAH
ncbi:hypothetical protein [Labedaea rhizosphaerae]|uniref:Uncharacterized protein n=1 Tax=Labedaea rhizosphaerae TaxID=598644 RepID=A0A4R6SFR7_LABRH|nr:hypothetical protein [Labedaea rhizosphaerae]TDQ00350.1 hypothetical protein EV186_102211 [Labedaea rhizosphaerae]